MGKLFQKISSKLKRQPKAFLPNLKYELPKITIIRANECFRQKQTKNLQFIAAKLLIFCLRQGIIE